MIILASRRPIPYQYDPQGYDSDTLTTFIPPGNEYNNYERLPETHSSTRAAPMSEIEAGRTKLHRLLDDVLDKAEPNTSYDPDSETEQRRLRRQRRRIHSASYDPRNSLMPPGHQQIPHTPMIPRVSERPDPTLLRLHHDSYEAGDRSYELQHAIPVVLTPKYSADDHSVGLHYPQPTYRSDRDVRILPNPQRQHRFDHDIVYIDTLPKHRETTQVPIHKAWPQHDDPNENYFHLNPNDVSTDPSQHHDYHDEYMMAKKSVVSTKNLISSIHDELQQIVAPSPPNSFHA